MRDAVGNFVIGTLTAGLAAGGATMNMAAADYAKLPTRYGFNLIVWDFTTSPAPAGDANREIVRVTGAGTSPDGGVTYDVPITRGQEGTTAANHNTAGHVYYFHEAWTSKLYDDLGGPWFALGPQGVLTNPQVLTTAAGVIFPAGVLRVGDRIKAECYIRQVIGNGTVGGRYAVQFGTQTVLGEVAPTGTADVGAFLEVWIAITSANTQRVWGRTSRDTNGTLNWWLGAVAGTRDITTQLALNFQTRFNGTNGTATLQAESMTVEVARSGNP